MKATLPEFEREGVMVVDDVMLDRYWYDPTSHILPGASVPVVRVNTIEERPGGAANVAMNAASLSTNACPVGLMGTGNAACTLSRSLADVNVECDFVSVSTHPTITKLWVFSRDQQLIRLNFEEDLEGVDPQPLHERINQVLSLIGVLVPSDYVKSALASIQQMIQLVRKAGVPVLIGLKGTDFERYHGVTLLTSDLSEFEAVVGKYKTEKETVERGMKLIVDYELSALLVTHSEQDMSLLQPGRAPLRTPTQTWEVYDVTGVGDTMIGVLAATLVAGNSLEEACFFANAVTGVTVDRLGTSMVPPVELESVIRGHADTGFGVMTEEELRLAIAAARKRSEKVMMVNGVFNILHAGHVSYLADARKPDDRLIVAVNNDVSTKWPRGDSRFVNPLKQRMIMLDMLEAVDWVVSLEEGTPQRLIAGILSDLLVKGGDYKPEEIAGSKKVWIGGGEVLVLNSKDDCPTTNIAKKIRQDKKG